MNKLQMNIEAGTRFISSETQDLFSNVVYLIPNWKWLALLLGLTALFFIRYLVLNILKKIISTQTYFAEKSFMKFFLKLDIERGLSWILISLAGMIFIESLELGISLERYLHIFFKVILAGNIIRMFYLAVDALGSKIQEWAKSTETQIDDQLAPLATKTLKVLVIIIGILIVLQNFGVDVTALLAGLGIGGVALAFAAQDTVANVFGTITILLDKPFKLGDKIKLGDTEGTVEEVGFRSTRIRTYYNSLVTLPNSMVAKEKIDNMTDRNYWMRFRNVVGVTYEANTKQIAQFIEFLKYRLLQDPTIDPNRISINLTNFNESSIDVLVNFHYKLQPDQDELQRNQEYLEAIYDVIDEVKLSFAFPTRSLIIENKNSNSGEMSDNQEANQIQSQTDGVRS